MIAPRFPPGAIAKMRELRASGLSHRQIATIFGTDEHTIFNHTKDVKVASEEMVGSRAISDPLETKLNTDTASNRGQLVVSVPVSISPRWLIMLSAEATKKGFDSIDEYLEHLNDRARQSDHRAEHNVMQGPGVLEESAAPRRLTFEEELEKSRIEIMRARVEGEKVRAFEEGMGWRESREAIEQREKEKEKDRERLNQERLAYIQRGIMQGLNPTEMGNALFMFNLNNAERIRRIYS